MIVRQFLQWVRTAPATARADATAALARAYLHSDLGPDDRAATEGAMIMLLDDASPLVRAMAVWAAARLVPAERIADLAADRSERETDQDVRQEWARVSAPPSAGRVSAEG